MHQHPVSCADVVSHGVFWEQRAIIPLGLQANSSGATLSGNRRQHGLQGWEVNVETVLPVLAIGFLDFDAPLVVGESFGLS